MDMDSDLRNPSGTVDDKVVLQVREHPPCAYPPLRFLCCSFFAIFTPMS